MLRLHLRHPARRLLQLSAHQALTSTRTLARDNILKKILIGLAIAFLLLALMLVSLFVYVGQTMSSAKSRVSELCAETRAGQSVEDFRRGATARDLPLRESVRAEEGKGATYRLSADAGFMTYAVSCAVVHDGKTISKVDLSEYD